MTVTDRGITLAKPLGIKHWKKEHLNIMAG